jgi:Zn-dependent M16 (insulinase) family peptidase
MSKQEFLLELTEKFPFPPSTNTFQVYKHHASELRLIFVPIPSPIVTAQLIVPTLCQSNQGLPHTLEHLVFCGSEHFPDRGYLDNLATRCLSTGTNAYTSEDHTCYEISTAGDEGMYEILPVFMDHVLHPNLRDKQFMTEVYHLDGEGKSQGVVYCEVITL